MKIYDRIADKYRNRDDVVIFSIINGRINSKEAVIEFIKRAGITCQVIYDEGGKFESMHGIGKTGYPVELKLDRGGVIREVVGGFPDPEIYYRESLKTIQELLEE